MSVVQIPSEPKADPVPVSLEPITLRTRQAAAVLSLSERKVKQLAAAGDLPSFKVGTCRLFHRQSLLEWAAAKEAAAGAEGGAA